MMNKNKLLIAPFAVVAIYYWITIILSLLSATSDFLVILAIVMIGLTIVSIILYLIKKEESSKNEKLN